MKTKSIIISSLLSLTFATAYAQSPAEMLEEGVQLQQNESDIDAAIKRFEAVLRYDRKWKKLTAEAHYRLAECYQTKGDEKRARKQLEALRESFPSDNRWVVKAAGLLPAETNFGPAPWLDGHSYQWEITLKNGQQIGYFLAAEHIVEAGEDPVWESYVVRNGGTPSMSRSKYHQKSHHVIDSRWFMKGMADNQAFFSEDNFVRIIDSETGEEIDSYDHARGEHAASMLYENEQMVQLVRCLNQEIGTKQKTLLIASLNNAVPIEFTMEVTEHTDIEVPAGTFPCAKIETNLKQTFYISRDDERRIVMMDLGAAKVSLIGEQAWDSLTPSEVKAKKIGSSFSLPGPVLFWVTADKEEIYRANLWPTDFAGRDGMLEVNLTKNLVEDAKAGSREFAETVLKNVGKSFDEWDALEDRWEAIEVDGVEGITLEVKGRMGEVTLREYQVFAVGEEKALTLRLGFTDPDRERTRARAKEIVANFQW
ncbi:tetratricopeptide repeat protein [Haloferula sp.]|uniref:tetratricopeptide repeat protein n=1 Tax=Haloferula sp. TaxID=2497595 RepID=UPI003C75F8AB